MCKTWIATLWLAKTDGDGRRRWSSSLGASSQARDAAIHEDTTDVDCFVVTRKAGHDDEVIRIIFI
ncbi:hypothetical protein CO026_00160 [Candidatus Kaiserbacteria bacterium CG_4_9_14_0_2_um_filter_41_32]|uniref:Uncharacterized protein n=1 Tax=Candidatus Kaiserbacteria bacterium CG_4_9_14_0_2_um_filter_41_32 TaxID=1974601 RepID=A0A2M8FFT3_9BACT|nr:MAG: hypothetical protein CO026_00160 [Candidatus Kaiserbacteria bacterium CG_4_9_14_0_2_um_filter_41_32]